MRIERHSEARVARVETKLRYALALALAAALGFAGFQLAGSKAEGAVRVSESTATVSLHKTALGAILANAKGHTLYMFVKDKHGKSACTGLCARYWPPVIAKTRPTAGAGLERSLLGTTTRSDGRKQVTYNRHPLYTFALDKRAGETNGQGSTGFGARWWALAATGRPVTRTATVTTGTTTTTPETTTAETTTTRYPYPP